MSTNRVNRIRQNPILSDIAMHSVFVLVCIVMVYPFWHTVVGSLLKYGEYFSKTLYVWSSDPTLEAYRVVLRTRMIVAPMYNTALITIVGTVFSLFTTSFVAYGLSKRFPGKTLIMSAIIFTMFFRGGLIPDYVLFKQLGLLNNRLVYILPAAINTFNLIILKTSFAAFPAEIEEAARIDGSRDFGIYFRMVLPLSIPMLVTIGLLLFRRFLEHVFPVTCSLSARRSCGPSRTTSTASSRPRTPKTWACTSRVPFPWSPCAWPLSFW